MATTGFSFTQTYTNTASSARLGVIHTPHGDIETPAFVPVGTQGSVKALSMDDVAALGTRLFFVNTYHMYLRPGMDVIRKAGGLHAFIGWNGPIITDSGGFQIFSLARNKFTKAPTGDGEGEPILVKMDDDGAVFRSHWDGSLHTFSPESSMEYQVTLGSDMHIAFDDCTPYPVTREAAERSMERTHRWAVRSAIAHRALMEDQVRQGKPYQALYGSIQGSIFEDLRTKSTRFIAELDTDGIAIGGVSVGESKAEMAMVLDWVSPLLPASKPRHLLGVGEPDDVFAAVERGVDTFDCVQPTRLARMGRVFVTDPRTPGRDAQGTVDLMKAQYAEDFGAPDMDCTCYTCTHHSRAYLHHLFKVRELTAYRLATIHNVAFMHRLVTDIRVAVREGSLVELKRSRLYNG